MSVSNFLRCTLEAQGKLDTVNARVCHYWKGVEISQWSLLTNQTDPVVVAFSLNISDGLQTFIKHLKSKRRLPSFPSCVPAAPGLSATFLRRRLLETPPPVYGCIAAPLRWRLAPVLPGTAHTSASRREREALANPPGAPEISLRWSVSSVWLADMASPCQDGAAGDEWLHLIAADSKTSEILCSNKIY